MRRSISRKASVAGITVPFLLFVFVRILNFTSVDLRWSDTHLYKFFAESIIAGQQPFSDFSVEYPPLTLILFIIPGFVARYVGDFVTVFRIEMAIFDLGCLLLIGKLATLAFGSETKRMLLALMLYIVLTAISFQLIYDRFDMVVAFLLLLAIYLATIRRRWTGAYIAIWVAALIKLFPVILFPLFLTMHMRESRNRNEVVNRFGLSVLVAIGAIIAVSFLVGDWSSVFAYHGKRGIQVESLYSAVALLASLAGLPAQIKHEFGAYQITDSFTPFLAQASFVFMAFSLLAVYYFFWRAIRKSKDDTANSARFIWSVLTALLAFVVLNKVLSPQFLIWLFPLAAIVAVYKKRPLIWSGLWILTAILTGAIFPYHYQALIRMETGAILILVARNILLVSLATISLKAIIFARERTL